LPRAGTSRLVENEPHLGGQHDVVTERGDRATHDPLRVPAAVDVGGVDEPDAAVIGRADGSYGDLVVDRSPPGRLTVEGPVAAECPSAHSQRRDVPRAYAAHHRVELVDRIRCFHTSTLNPGARSRSRRFPWPRCRLKN